MQHKNPSAPAMRDTRFELLRILSLLLIIAHHYSVHGGFEFSRSVMSFNRVLVQFLSLGGKVGVNCFVFLTGYFMATSKFSLKKCLMLIAEVFFYSVLSLLVVLMMGQKIPINKLVMNFLPITTGIYWFATTYIILYISAPILNILNRSISQRQHLKLIVVALFLWCIIPTFTEHAPAFSQTVWFFTLYEIAAYIRLYPNNVTCNFKLHLGMFVFSYVLLAGSVIVLDLIGLRHEYVSNRALHFAKENSLPTFLCSLSLFLVFKNMKPVSSKLVNRCAASMFGVYLIHDNPGIRQIVWGTLFRNSAFAESDLLFLYAILSILVVFLASLAIDQLRIATLEKPVSRLIDRMLEKMRGVRRKATVRFDRFARKMLT